MSDGQGHLSDMMFSQKVLDKVGLDHQQFWDKFYSHAFHVQIFCQNGLYQAKLIASN
jgi:hypothetical protein